MMIAGSFHVIPDIKSKNLGPEKITLCDAMYFSSL